MRQAKRCFALGTRLRGCDRYLVLQRSRPVCFMKIVDFMRTITPFHGVHTYADTNRRGTISAA